MALSPNTVIYDVQQVKIYPMSTVDTVGGASPTYGAGIILEGAADFSVTPNIVTAELKGDGGQIISKMGRVDMWSASITYGRLGLSILSAVMGGAYSDTGTGSAETIAWALSAPNLLPYFKLEAQILNTDNGVGSVNAVLFKCSLKSATFLDSKTDAFGQPKMDVEAIPLLSTNEIGVLTMYATATAIDV